MASQIDGSTGIPLREDIFTVDGGEGRLVSHLDIKPPEDSAKTPPVLSFKRKREVEIPWGDVFKGITEGSPGSVSALRAYFQRSWGYDDESLKNALADDKDLLFKGDKPLVQQVAATGDAPAPAFSTAFQADGTATAEPIESGFLLRQGSSGRLYHLIEAAPGLTADHFKDWERYDQSLWKDHVLGAELVFETADEATVEYTDFEEVDLRAAVIDRKFGELRLALKFATQVQEKVSAITEQLIGDIVNTSLNADEIENLQRRVLRLQIGEQDAQRAIERLVSQAASLGFVLLPEGGKVPAPELGEGKKRDVDAGLYQEYTRTARWTTTYKVRKKIVSGWWIFKTTRIEEFDRTKTHEQQVLAYKRVDTSKDLLSETRQDLAAKGMEVFVFDRSPDGFVTVDGTPLRRVMDRCDFDEEFRRHCAVLLPVYEHSLLGDRMVAKYSVFKRPLPGILPTMLPRLALEETLSYRISWREMQLGELINSINLAPGEERQVTMTKSFKHETTVSRSTTSVFDISQSESTDLATEMENQTRQESQQSTNFQSTATASGSYGPFSASATASGGTTRSLNEVSQAISKVARKAARSVSQQNREEVSSSSTARTEITKTDETKATLTNINQGRSLNLMFYRVNNKFSGGLFLDDLGFSVIPGVELIAGSGVHDSRGYGLQELPRLLDEFDDEQLPFDLKSDQRAEYGQRVLESIRKLLESEYMRHSQSEARESKRTGQAQTMSMADETGAQEPGPTISVGLLCMPTAPAKPAAKRERRGGRKSAAVAEVAADATGFDEFAEALRKATIDSDAPMVPQDLLVSAPGLYLDAVVGAQPGTEPYSEEMRVQEVRMRAADVFARESEGLYQRAQALRLARMFGNDAGGWITGVIPLREHKALMVSLSEPLPEGNWHIRFDGRSVATLDRSKTIGRNSIRRSWQKEQDWLKTADLISRVDLFDEDTGATIEYSG